MDLAAVLADLFPITSANFTLEFVALRDALVAGQRRRTEALVATLRLVPAGDDDGALAYTQDVDLVYPMHADDPRLPAYVTGWASALRSLLARRDELEMVGALPGGHRQALAPADLVHPDVLYAGHLATPAEFAHALLFGTSRLGRLLPDSLDVRAAFVDRLPIAAGPFTLELVPETIADTGEIFGGCHESAEYGLTAVLRLTIDDGDPRAREGFVCVARSEHAHDPRLPEYFAGWALALRTLFDRHAALDADDPRRVAFTDVGPSALVCSDALALQRPRTPEAFAAALLAGKRLGRLLP